MTAEYVMTYVNGLLNSEERVNAENQWHKLSEYFLPSQSGYFRTKSAKGVRKEDIISTSYPIIVNETLANTLASTLAPKSEKWAAPRLTSEELRKDKNASVWVENAGKRILEELASSNFYYELGKSFKGFTCFGSLILDCGEKDPTANKYTGLVFKSRHLSTTAWQENKNGFVDVFGSKYQMPIINLIEAYGEKESWSKLIAEDPTAESCVYTLLKPEPDGTFTETTVDEASGDVLEVTTFKSQPRFCARYETMPEQVCGHAPGHTGLRSAITLNTVREEILQERAIANRPPILTEEDALFANLDMTPGSQNVVANLDGIRAFEYRGDKGSQQLTENELKEELRQAFLLDKLMLPPREQIGEMSVYETAKRLEQMSKAVGQVPERVFGELLQPLILRVFHILLDRGVFGEVPESIVRSGSLDLDVAFDNQLTRAQKFESIRTAQSLLNYVGQAASFDDSAPLAVDVPQSIAVVAEALGAPAQMLRPIEEVAKEVEQRRQAQQQMMLQQAQAEQPPEGGQQ